MGVRLSNRLSNQFVVGVATAGAAFTAWMPLADLLGWVVLLLGLSIVAYFSIQEPALAGPLLVAFLLRGILAVLQSYGISIPESSADAAAFERLAWSWSRSMAGPAENFSLGSDFYPWLSSLIYRWTLRSPFLLRAINVVLSIATIWFAVRTTANLWNPSAAIPTAWLLAVYPSFVLYGALILRETPILCALSVGVYYFTRWARLDRSRHFLLALAAFGFSAAFHPGLLITLVVACVWLGGRWIRSTVNLEIFNIARRMTGIAAIGVLTLIVVVTGLGVQKFADSGTITVELIGQLQAARAVGRAGYLQGMVVHEPLDFVWQLPIRSIYFLFTPFPWMVNTTTDIMGLADVLFFGMILGVVLRSYRSILSEAGSRELFVLAVALIAIFAMGTSNYGTAFRHRTKILLVLAVLAPALWYGARPPNRSPGT